VSFFLTRAGHPFLSRFKKNGKDFGAPKSLPFFIYAKPLNFSFLFFL
jgi:hypothetical protein